MPEQPTVNAESKSFDPLADLSLYEIEQLSDKQLIEFREAHTERAEHHNNLKRRGDFVFGRRLSSKRFGDPNIGM